MEGDSTLDIGRLCLASFFATVLLFTGSDLGWARQPAAPVIAVAPPSPSPATALPAGDPQPNTALPDKPLPPAKRNAKVPLLVHHHVELISAGPLGLRCLTV